MLKALFRILRPNTPYVVISLDNTIVTGGFYMASHTLYETFMGRIHSFVLPSLLNEGTQPSFTIFIRRMVHYMHNAHVENDSSDRSHLLSLTSMDDARDLFSLVAMSLFSNVLDERTYQLSCETHEKDHKILQQCFDVFDLNAIPVIERYHLSYTRGLSTDLLNWFLENYSFSSIDFDEDDVNGFSTIFVPFVVHIGRQIIKYKRMAENSGKTTLSTLNQVIRQVQHALYGLEIVWDAWLEAITVEEEDGFNEDLDQEEDVELGPFDLDFDFSDYTIRPREVPIVRRSSANFLLDGKSNADKRFFCGLASQFKLENLGNYFLFFYFTHLILSILEILTLLYELNRFPRG